MFGLQKEHRLPNFLIYFVSKTFWLCKKQPLTINKFRNKLKYKGKVQAQIASQKNDEESFRMSGASIIHY